MSELKQVIVICTGLGMSRGKTAAQAAHASVAALLHSFEVDMIDKTLTCPLGTDVWNWQEGSHTKIILAVNTEDELIGIYNDAQNAGLPRSIVKDEGRTELTGQHYTAVGIGPAHSYKIDPITDDLPLL